MLAHIKVNGANQRGAAGVGIIGFRVNESAANRNTAIVEIFVQGASPVYTEGAQVEIGRGSANYFTGTIDSFKRQWLNPQSVILRGEPIATRWTLNCVSFDHIASRRVVTISQSYTAKAAGYIFRDVATQFLGGENLSVSGVQDGPTFEAFTIEAGATVYQVFDSIAEKAGMYWDILGTTGNPQLRFYSRGSIPSSWSLDESSPVIIGGDGQDGLELEIDRRQVANEILVELSEGPGNPTEQDFLGDGSAREFVLAKPVDAAPKIFVNGVEKAVSPEDYIAADWYFRLGSPNLRQDATQPLLTPSDLLHVEYTPRERVLITGAQDSANIAARAAAEASSGRYQTVIRAADGATVADATTAAQAYLAAHKDSASRLTARAVAAEAETLRVGETISLNYPKIGAVGTYFVEAAERACLGKNQAGDDDVIIHRFTLSRGAVLGDAWTLLGSAWQVGSSASASVGGAVTANGAAALAVQDLGVLAANTVINPSPSGPATGDLLLVRWQFGASVFAVSWGTAFAGVAQAAYRARASSTHLYFFIFTGTKWDLIAWRTDTQ